MALALVAAAGAARDVDPLKSRACTQALEALQAHEEAMRAVSSRVGANDEVEQPKFATLEALRRQAARDCLGRRLDAPPPAQRPAQPPVTVAPATPSPATWAVMPPMPGAVPPPIRIPPLQTLTTCDPTGCWANDGTRLQRIGSALFGPLGLCTVQGAVLSCP